MRGGSGGCGQWRYHCQPAHPATATNTTAAKPPPYSRGRLQKATRHQQRRPKAAATPTANRIRAGARPKVPRRMRIGPPSAQAAREATAEISAGPKHPPSELNRRARPVIIGLGLHHYGLKGMRHLFLRSYYSTEFGCAAVRQDKFISRSLFLCLQQGSIRDTP